MIHPFGPVWDGNSRILILGSFPSVKSRETDFYYGHERNRFWPMTAALFGANVPATKEEKIRLLKENRIALWDVIKSCEIHGSSDSSIRNAEVNDIKALCGRVGFEKILCNGGTSYRLYERYVFPLTGIRAVKMPSTSPANAGTGLDRLVEIWGGEIKE